MKKIILLFSVLSILFASDCKKEDDNCHKTILIENNSSNIIFYGEEIKIALTDSCNFLYHTINPFESSNNNLLRSCWEARLSDKMLEIYFMDSTYLNFRDELYHCDSLETIEGVLIKKELTLEVLRANNFTVSYP